MMKKVTVITSPGYEALLLEAIGKNGLAHLIEVKGADFERLKLVAERPVDYGALYDRLNASYRNIMEHEAFEVTPSIAYLKELGENPEKIVNEIIGKLEDGRNRLERARINFEEAKVKLIEIRARLEALRALKPEELKRGLAAGILKSTPVEGQGFAGLSRIEEHLRRFEDVTFKMIEISPEELFLLVFGPEERRSRIEALFLVFDVKDIFDALSVKDILLALDIRKREEILKEYGLEIDALQKFIEGEGEINKIKDELNAILGGAEIVGQSLRVLSDKEVPILKTKLIDVLQGWVPTDKIPQIKQVIGEIEGKTGESFFVQFEEPSHEEEEKVPTQRPTIRPKFFEPAFTLTSLRGWPSAHELNPSIVTLLVFSFQFGIMFGDVGQGLIFLILGFILSKKFKSGLASKLGVAFIPMGIMCMIFGFLYGEVFLIEGLIHPLLLSPIHSIGSLFKTVLGLAVVEMSLGLVLGAINEYKEGNIAGVIGEHGAGGILFFVGLYFGGLHFLATKNFMAILGHWSFMMLMIGLVMTFVEPILHAVLAHKKMGFEVVGEGMAAFLITFIEGLCNFFSFLRMAAFALAHGGLAIAAHALSGTMGVGAIILMNVIAMTFEFISSSVQSLRLLYYEFMGKFFRGTGTPYKPFRMRRE